MMRSYRYNIADKVQHGCSRYILVIEILSCIILIFSVANLFIMHVIIRSDLVLMCYCSDGGTKDTQQLENEILNGKKDIALVLTPWTCVEEEALCDPLTLLFN
jgi:hypothetical protein